MFGRKSAFVAIFGVAAVLLTVSICAGNVHAQEKAAAPSTMTLDNLMVAYNGESNAHARYLAFSGKAHEEGYDAVADLFKAASMAEQVHFKRHAEVIKKLGGTPKAVIETPDVKSTKENLEAAVKGETYESKEMYPAFLKQAKKEKIKDAIDAFEDAGAAEGVHAGLFAKMLKNLDLSKNLSKDFYVCPLCGNIMDTLNRSLCPICMTPTKKFMKAR